MRPALLEQRCLDVLHATSVGDFKKQIISFTHDLGFETVGAMTVTAHSATLTEFQTVTNAPQAFLNEFHDQSHARLDPVNKHCASSSSPIVWDRRNYANGGAGMLWELQEPFGYRSGIALAMHFSRGRHFMFGANWSKDRCDSSPHFRSIAEDLVSFSQHAQAAAFELCQPSRLVEGSELGLAVRELEALRWTMDGLTAWEIAAQMSISERHAALLLRRVMAKLGCSTKYESGLRAIKLGLIR